MYDTENDGINHKLHLLHPCLVLNTYWGLSLFPQILQKKREVDFKKILVRLKCNNLMLYNIRDTLFVNTLFTYLCSGLCVSI